MKKSSRHVQRPIIYLLDNDRVVRQTAASLSSTHGARPRAYTAASEFFADVVPNHPGCIVVGDQLPDATPLQFLERAKAKSIPNCTMIVGTPGNANEVLQLWDGGAFAFLPRPTQHDAVLAKLVASIEFEVRKNLRRSRVKQVQLRVQRLTKRESEIAQLVSRGLTSRRIAEDLGIGQRTVETHRRNILEKMEVSSVAELIAGLTQVEDDFEPSPGAAG